MKRTLLASGIMLAISSPALAADNDELERLIAEQEQRIQQLESSQSDRGRLSLADLKVSGFINAAGGATNEGTTGTNYEGLDGEITYTQLTSAGLQLDASVNDKVSATLQFFADGRADFDTEVEWAYITYRPTSSLSFRAGQLVLPLYMHSQYQIVGYAYNWITVPQEVYSTAPVRTLQGWDVTWQFSTGNVAHALNFAAGNQKLDQDLGGVPITYRVDRSTTLNLTSHFGNWSTWLGASTARIDLPLPDLTGFGGADLSPFSMEDDEGLFTSVGVTYDDGAVVFNAERVELDFETDWAATNVGQYVMFGYRLGRFLPTVTWASVKDKGWSDLPGDYGLATPIAQGLYNSIATRQESMTYGLRVDLDGGLALKAEIMTFDDLGNADQADGFGGTTNSLWGGATPDEDDDPMVFRAAAHMVF